MPLNTLKRNFEERRVVLVEKLQRREGLDLSQQHQVYGAIREIENFLKAIEYHQSEQAANGIDLDLLKEREWPIVHRLRRGLSSIGRGAGSAFKFTVITLPARAYSGVKRSVTSHQARRRLANEVREEILRRRQSGQPPEGLSELPAPPKQG